MWPGRSEEAKRELAEKARAFMAEQMNMSEEYFAVSIEEISPDEWDGELDKVPEEQRIIWPEKQ